MSRSAAVLSTVILALFVSACDGPNCFAGECVAGVPEGPSQEAKDYFFDVVIGSEFGIETLLRHAGHVNIRVQGSPTPGDEVEVERVIDDLEDLTDLSISLTDEPAAYNIHFIPRSEFGAFTGDPSEEWDAFFTILFRDSGVIDQAVVLVATDMPADAQRRNAIRKMMTHAFGIVGESNREPTSIFYHELNDVATFSPLDRFVITTAYDPLLEPGMTREEMIDALDW